MAHLMLFLSSLAVLVTLQGSHAVQYEVINNATGTRFANEIGPQFSEEILKSASEFIWRTFRQPTDADRKSVQQLILIVKPMIGLAYATNNEIHFNADYIASYNGDLKVMFTGVLYHEVAHVWQWFGNANASDGLIEGIADYVRLEAGYLAPHWAQPGGGDRWNQGYDVTARFLEYCNSLKDGFVAELNARMRNSYSVTFFKELLGKTVDQLWSDYKSTYGN